MATNVSQARSCWGFTPGEAEQLVGWMVFFWKPFAEMGDRSKLACSCKDVLKYICIYI